MVTTQEASVPVSQIQTDTFCPGCSYNLFSQAVIREPHTGILVIRCPECGKFSPAGIATDAASRWQSTQAVMFLLLRLLAALYAMGLALFGMGALPYATADAAMRIHQYGGSASPEAFWQKMQLMRGVFAAGALGLGFATGMFAVLMLYHWPRKHYRWLLAAPVVALVIACVVWQAEYPGRLFVPIRHAPASGGIPSPALHMTAVTLLIIAGVWVGARYGRPLARGILRAFFSAQALQPLAVLWWADDKVPPSPKAPEHR